jgi:hypothetical protein
MGLMNAGFGARFRPLLRAALRTFLAALRAVFLTFRAAFLAARFAPRFFFMAIDDSPIDVGVEFDRGNTGPSRAQSKSLVAQCKRERAVLCFSATRDAPGETAKIGSGAL